MDAKAIVLALGGATKLAAALGCKRSAVSNWPKDGIPSKYWQDVIELAKSRHVDGVTQAAVRWRPVSSYPKQRAA